MNQSVQWAPGAVPNVLPAYFDIMARHARDHWWYQNRREWLTELLKDRVRVGGRAVDVGCGTGETLAALSRTGLASPVGTDLSQYVLKHACIRSPFSLLRSSAENLPFADGSFACLTSLDVIEHLDDDLKAVEEYIRVVEPGGTVVLMTPAYQWMWSEHDERAGHRRRYTARRLTTLARQAGLQVEFVSYFNWFLLPPAAAIRRSPLRRLRRPSDEDVCDGVPSVSRAFAALARMERAAAKRWRIPFGLSVVLVARVPAR
ncbi:MAG: class I SAM-dependent methyltransferase [Acidimicrobiales bacterium]